MTTRGQCCISPAFWIFWVLLNVISLPQDALKGSISRSMRRSSRCLTIASSTQRTTTEVAQNAYLSLLCYLMLSLLSKHAMQINRLYIGMHQHAATVLSLQKKI